MPTRVTGNFTWIQTTAASGSQTITVPAAADGMFVCAMHYNAAGNNNLTTLTQNSVSLLPAEASLGDGEVADATSLAIYHLRSPGTGTFAWTWGGGAPSGGGIAVGFYEDDSGFTTSVRASVVEQSDFTAGNENLTSAVGDLIIGMATAYDSAAPSTITTANSTLISGDPEEGSGSGSPYARVYDITAVATQTNIVQGGQSFGGIVAMSLQDVSAGGGGPLIPPMRRRPLQNLLRR